MRLARTQAGVLTRAQLRRHQKSRKVRERWARGWVTLVPGFYCTKEPTWHSWCWAGLERGGSGAVVGGAAAGHLHGFVKEPPKRITIFHTRQRPLAGMGDGAVRVELWRGTRAGRGTPPRTSVEVAILDLAGECDEDATIMAATRAIAEGMTTPSRIVEELQGRRAVRHRRVLERVCEEASKGIESVLEWRFLELVLRAHGLPLPTRQVPVVEHSRSDNVWDEFGLLVELDGHLGHEDAFRDMDRDNRAALKGYTTLRYGWHDVVERPAEVAAQIRKALAAGGWVGARAGR
ncbi:DUF559 domain-containing protein [Tessaracoccus terricola]